VEGGCLRRLAISLFPCSSDDLVLCPITAAGTDSKQRIRAGVVCIKGGRPSSPCWGPQNHQGDILEPLVEHALQRRHAQAGGVDEGRLTCWSDAIGDWRDGRHGRVARSRGKSSRAKGLQSACCGHNSAILQPGISHPFSSPSHQSLGGPGPTNSSLLSGTHITCIRRPLTQFAVGSGSDADAGAAAYPNDFHVRYARRWSLASSWMRWMGCPLGGIMGFGTSGVNACTTYAHCGLAAHTGNKPSQKQSPGPRVCVRRLEA
jgi:hypothetical protein